MIANHEGMWEAYYNQINMLSIIDLPHQNCRIPHPPNFPIILISVTLFNRVTIVSLFDLDIIPHLHPTRWRGFSVHGKFHKEAKALMKQQGREGGRRRELVTPHWHKSYCLYCCRLVLCIMLHQLSTSSLKPEHRRHK